MPGHGRRAARKTSGLEAALVDNEVMEIKALEPEDRRRTRLRVAKTHKIADRIDAHREDRLNDKDGADVVRLMATSSPAAVAATLQELLAHPVSAAATSVAAERFEGLFGRRGGIGIALAQRSLREAMPAERVQAISLAYTSRLYAALPDFSTE